MVVDDDDIYVYICIYIYLHVMTLNGVGEERDLDQTAN